MRIATVAAALLFVISAGIFIYMMAIAPRIGREVEEQGYRPPIQDQVTPRERKEPFEKSNVPPATEKSK
jgi:hypothetical protein